MPSSIAGSGYSAAGSAPSGTSGGNTLSYGRVIDVIIDSFHPQYEDRGSSLSLNGIFYRELNEATSEDEEGELKFAYAGVSEFKKIPLKNEIVELIGAPSEFRDANVFSTKTYWVRIVPVWNHPNHNVFPDVRQFPEQEDNPDYGENFEPKEHIAPIQAFPGDVIMEGRHGNSIRLGGTKHDTNIFTDGNNSEPFTIISNGQAEPGNGDDPIVEDINKDPASIYMGSDHKFELTQANEKRDAFEEEPDLADVYQGSQIILNSGRLYFNAKEDSAFISATEAIGLNAQYIGIDGEKYVGLDAEKIYLGTDAFKESEPVLLGQTAVDWLDDFISQFETIVKGMATAPPAPPAYVAKMVATANSVLPVIPQIKNLLKQLLSKKVFTE